MLKLSKKIIESVKTTVMKDFDWEKTHKVMTFLDWNWNRRRVPTIPELKEEAERLFNNAIEYIEKYPDFNHIESGGLRVTITGDRLIELAFILASGSGHTEDAIKRSKK